MRFAQWLAPVLLAAAMSSYAQERTFQTKSLTPETALTAARAALDACRKQGFQVAVAVTDRAGITQVLIRDRFAGPHTVEVASNKAWTAVSFRTSTIDLAVETQPGRPMSGLRNLPRFLAVGGGRVIEAGEAFSAPSAFQAARAAKAMMAARPPASRPLPMPSSSDPSHSMEVPHGDDRNIRDTRTQAHGDRSACRTGGTRIREPMVRILYRGAAAPGFCVSRASERAPHQDCRCRRPSAWTIVWRQALADTRVLEPWPGDCASRSTPRCECDRQCPGRDQQIRMNTMGSTTRRSGRAFRICGCTRAAWCQSTCFDRRR